MGALVVAYVLGSIPTAVLAGRRAGVEIRNVGDGNMGARNVARMLGARPAIAVALVDVSKGTIAVLLAHFLGLPQHWVCAVGWAALLGHDFPAFAGFRGGQGLATTIGVLLVLLFPEMIVALCLYGALYLLTRDSDIGASVGLGVGIFLAFSRGCPAVLLVDAVAMLLSIPVKKWLDRHRRFAAQAHGEVEGGRR